MTRRFWSTSRPVRLSCETWNSVLGRLIDKTQQKNYITFNNLLSSYSNFEFLQVAMKEENVSDNQKGKTVEEMSLNKLVLEAKKQLNFEQEILKKKVRRDLDSFESYIIQ